MTSDSMQQRQALLAANIASVRATLAQAAQRSGRDPAAITLIAVSKTKPLELIQQAYSLGITNFGENRIQEALPKIAAFHQPDIRWHMIGHVQSNKASKVARSFEYVHSIDSVHLAHALNTHATEQGRRLPILLQVNVSGEQSKAGMTPAEVSAQTRQIIALEHLIVQGLMTVAPLVNDAEEVRPVFRALRLLRDQLQAEFPDCSWQHLSMGMTDDYPIAIEEGATIVRIGRAIFGERPPTQQDGPTHRATDT